MTRYKNIYTSLNTDINYLLAANEYWCKKDEKYNTFIDFVKNELINPMDLQILRLVAKKDRNIDNTDKFINYLLKEYIEEVKNFCIGWQLPIEKSCITNE